MTKTVRNEIDRAERRANTLRLLDSYLRDHVGESFTCRELCEKFNGSVSPQIMAYWLSHRAAAFGVKITIHEATIHFDTPLNIKDWYGRSVLLSDYTVNIYTVEALDRSWEKYGL